MIVKGSLRLPGNTHSIIEYGAKVDGKSFLGTIAAGSLNKVTCTGYSFTYSRNVPDQLDVAGDFRPKTFLMPYVKEH